MKWRLSLPETPMLVYYYVKITGLAPFTVRNDGFYPPNILDKLCPVVSAAIHCFITTMGVVALSRRVVAQTLSRLHMIGDTFQQLVGAPIPFLTLITFLLMNKRIVYVMDELRDIGEELKSLGIEEDREKFFKNLLATTLMTNAVTISFCAVLCCAEPNWPIVSSTKYVVDAWLYLNVILIFTQILFLIGKRFELINEKLHNVFGPADHRRIFTVCGTPREVTRSGIEDLTDLQQIRKIEALHYQLCDLMRRTSGIFAFPVISKTVECSTGLVLHSYWIYWISRNSGETHTTADIVTLAMNISCSLIRIIIASYQLFAIAYASAITCEEGNATKAVLFKVWYKFAPRNVEDECYMFSLQLMQKPVVVSILGFFDLDYSYVYKILGVVVAYLIILIQFD